MTTPAARDSLGGLNDDNDLNVFRHWVFFDANEGYFEAGYGRVEGKDEFRILIINP